MDFDISTIDIRVSIRVCGLHLVFFNVFFVVCFGFIALVLYLVSVIGKTFKVQCYAFFVWAKIPLNSTS